MLKVTKWEATASAGWEAVIDSEKSHHCNHCFRVGGPEQFIVLIPKAQWQEHKLLCHAVSQLSNSESREF